MYPLKFQVVFQERIWGGSRLDSILAKPIPQDLRGKPLGESWELADLPPGTVQVDSRGAQPNGSLSSVITNGPWAGKTLHEAMEIAAQNGTPLTDQAALVQGRFPLLIKFLDAQADLSVQVHPDAEYCTRHPGSALKSEAWYIMHAEPNAKIYKGVKPGVTKEQFAGALKDGTVEPLMQAYKVRAGDCHYLPSGTVHALGAGILAAEVQTPSDTTFRVFDWNRTDAQGKPRKLHVEQALEAIHFSPPTAADMGGSRSHVAGIHVTVSRLVTCEFFTLERVRMAEGYQQEIPYDQAVVWMVLEGQGVINCEGVGPTAFTKGDTLLLPANMKNATVKMVTDGAWLEAKLPGGSVEVG